MFDLLSTNRLVRSFASLLVAASLIGVLAPAALAQSPTREITLLKGDVYRFRNNHHYSVFVITGDGVVVTDPINRQAAAWLKTEIAKMTDQPITHLVYSHSHGDHASGGLAFGAGLSVITQQNAPASIDGVKPTDRFADNYEFALGSKRFELTGLGPGHGEDLLALVIRPENVLFTVDAVAASRVPYRDFPGVDIAGLAEQIRRVEALSFDLFAPGHGNTGVAADVSAQREYVSELTEQVQQGLDQGLQGEALVAAAPMAKYREWGAFEQWHALNVAGMARWLSSSK